MKNILTLLPRMLSRSSHASVFILCPAVVPAAQKFETQDHLLVHDSLGTHNEMSPRTLFNPREERIVPNFAISNTTTSLWDFRGPAKRHGRDRFSINP